MQFQFEDTPVSVNVPHAAALLTAVKARLAAGEGFALATINLDHLVKLRTMPEFRHAYAAQIWSWPMATRLSGFRGWRGARSRWCRGRKWCCRWPASPRNVASRSP